MAPDQVARQPELLPQLPHLVLVEVAEGLDDPACRQQPLDDGDAVVVGLDGLGVGGPARLDAVGVEGPLPEQPLLGIEGEFLEGAVPGADELVADAPALDLRIADPGDRGEELPAGVYDLEVLEPRLPHQPGDRCGLVLAHEAVVDVQAEDAVAAQRPVEEQEADARIDAAADEQEQFPAGAALPQRGDRLADEVLHRPGALAPAQVEEVVENPHSRLGVGDLRMELHAPDAALRVPHRRYRTVLGLAEALEPRRHFRDRVAVAHPDPFLPGQAGKHPGRRVHPQRRRPELHPVSRFDAPSEVVAEQLVAVAEPEHRQAASCHLRIERRAVLGVHARRPPGKDDAAGVPQAVRRRVGGKDLGVDVEAADAVGDQVGVLTAEVEDGNAGVHGVLPRGEGDCRSAGRGPNIEPARCGATARNPGRCSDGRTWPDAPRADARFHRNRVIFRLSTSAPTLNWA